MTHPHLTSALPPLGARSLAFRSNPARVIYGRKTNPLTMHFDSAVAVQACCDMPIRRSERHPRKILTDPNNEVAVEFTLI
ncbi:MAG: hypothetical protein WBM59_12235 [Sedimenticolaceae bacterium]|jgi:hypothetical protein